MPRARLDIPTVAALAGAAALAALALRALPRTSGLTPPSSPFARSHTPFLSRPYGLLRDAAAVVPAGASAVVLAGPRDPRLESHFFRLGLALLPGRTVLPAAQFDAFTPEDVWRGAEYRIVVGGRPAPAEGDLVLETPDGSVWRRRSP